MGSETQSALRFFVLKSEPDSNHDTSFERTGSNLGKAPQCTRCGSFLGMREWLPPYQGILERHGMAFGDLLRGPSGGFLASARFVEAFRVEGLTGVPAFHPVDVVRARGHAPAVQTPAPQYFYLRPVLGRAAVDDSRSHIQRSRPVTCDECRQTGVDAIQGFALDEASWGGEDMFFARGLPGSVIVSERFRRFSHRHRFTNLRLVPTEQYTGNSLSEG